MKIERQEKKKTIHCYNWRNDRENLRALLLSLVNNCYAEQVYVQVNINLYLSFKCQSLR